MASGRDFRSSFGGQPFLKCQEVGHTMGINLDGQRSSTRCVHVLTWLEQYIWAVKSLSVAISSLTFSCGDNRVVLLIEMLAVFITLLVNIDTWAASG